LLSNCTKEPTWSRPCCACPSGQWNARRCPAAFSCGLAGELLDELSDTSDRPRPTRSTSAAGNRPLTAPAPVIARRSVYLGRTRCAAARLRVFRLAWRGRAAMLALLRGGRWLWLALQADRADQLAATRCSWRSVSKGVESFIPRSTTSRPTPTFQRVLQSSTGQFYDDSPSAHRVHRFGSAGAVQDRRSYHLGRYRFDQCWISVRLLVAVR